MLNVIESTKREITQYFPGSENNPTAVKPTNVSSILLELNKYGFSDLEKLTRINVKELVNHIFGKKTPFQIAYLYYLGFVKHLDDNYCETHTELHTLLATILNINSRAVRGNVNGLRNEKSKDRNRYTAHKHLEEVEKHYEKVK